MIDLVRSIPIPLPARSASRQAGTPRLLEERGFTFIELVAVTTILALTLALVVPSMEQLAPSYRLRASIREIGSTIDLAYSLSVEDQEEYAVAYDIDSSTYWVVAPPVAPDSQAEEDDEPLDDPLGLGEEPEEKHGELVRGFGRRPPPPDPDQPEEEVQGVEERDEIGDHRALPRDVRFSDVLIANEESRSHGIVYVTFSPLANTGSHIVHLTLRQDSGTSSSESPTWAVKFSAVAGTLHYEEARLEFLTREGDDP